MPEELGKNQIHIYVIDLDQSQSVVKKKTSLLSPDERKRALRFQSDPPRRRFVLSRSTLREILGQYLRVEPQTIRFGYTKGGKPYLENPSLKQKISFNVAHSENLAVIALTWEGEIGIDVEWIKSRRNMEAIVHRFFSETERQSYLSAPEEQKREVFYHCWTAKEALIKATDRKLFSDLGSFSIEAGKDRPPQLLSAPGDKRELEKWHFYQFNPQKDYIATLVYPSKDTQIKKMRWKY